MRLFFRPTVHILYFRLFTFYSLIASLVHASRQPKQVGKDPRDVSSHKNYMNLNFCSWRWIWVVFAFHFPKRRALAFEGCVCRINWPQKSQRSLHCLHLTLSAVV